jgi:hypothetical protein
MLRQCDIEEPYLPASISLQADQSISYANSATTIFALASRSFMGPSTKAASKAPRHADIARRKTCRSRPSRASFCSSKAASRAFRSAYHPSMFGSFISSSCVRFCAYRVALRTGPCVGQVVVSRCRLSSARASYACRCSSTTRLGTDLSSSAPPMIATSRSSTYPSTGMKSGMRSIGEAT